MKQKRAQTKLGAVAVIAGLDVGTAVHDFVAYQQRKGSAARTIEYISHYLRADITRNGWKPLLRWCRDNAVNTVDQLTKDNLGRYFDEERAVMSPSSYSRLVTLTKRLCRYLVEEGELPALPMRFEVQRGDRKEIDVFTVEEMHALAKTLAKENVRDFAIFHLLLDTGIRANELCTLRCQDFRWDREELVVRAEITKTRTERVLHLGSSLGPLLKYRRLREPYGTEDIDYFFLSFWSTPVVSGGVHKLSRRTLSNDKVSFRKAPLGPQGLYQLVRKWGGLAKIKDARCSPHTFRHFFAIQFLRNGGNVMELQRALGHASLKQTAEYVRYAQTDMKKARKFSPGWDFLPGRGQKLEVT